MPPVEAVLIGAGQRGFEIMGNFAMEHPDLLKFVAVAEPDEERRSLFAEQHGIAPDNRFAHFEALLDRPQIAPLCFNASMDRQHLPSAVGALEAGYDLFLEKPMAVTAQECVTIAAKARAEGRMIQICHPLRHTPFYTRVKSLLDEGIIGRPIVFLMHENVAHWHFAHSYVRGNWSQLETSGPLTLTKCCHDMDVAAWLIGESALKVSSFGGLSHFTPANAPEGATERCLDGCPVVETCPHSAPAIYLTDNSMWPASVISNDRSLEGRRRALETGPYGRCVFHHDNTAPDHQTVGAEFESGITLSFTVQAHTAECFRTIRILGSEGELNGHLERADITVTHFKPGMNEGQTPEKHDIGPVEGSHLGGDPKVIRFFLGCHATGDRESLERSLDIAVEGHLLSFAAEESRLTGQTIDMADYRSRMNG